MCGQSLPTLEDEEHFSVFRFEPSKTIDEQISSAAIMMHNSWLPESNAYVYLHYCEPKVDSNSVEHKGIYFMLRRAELAISHENWFSLNISNILAGNYFQSELLTLYAIHKSPVSYRALSQQPYLQLAVQPRRRVTRSTQICTDDSPGCCLEEHVIDTREIGLPYDIYPVKLSIRGCQGKCKFPFHDRKFQSAKEAFDLFFFNHSRPIAGALSERCCIATDFAPMAVLVRDRRSPSRTRNRSNELQSKRLENVDAIECACFY